MKKILFSLLISIICLSSNAIAESKDEKQIILVEGRYKPVDGDGLFWTEGWKGPWKMSNILSSDGRAIVATSETGDSKVYYCNDTNYCRHKVRDVEQSMIELISPTEFSLRDFHNRRTTLKLITSINDQSKAAD